jgi:hypothetical protein
MFSYKLIQYFYLFISNNLYIMYKRKRRHVNKTKNKQNKNTRNTRKIRITRKKLKRNKKYSHKVKGGYDKCKQYTSYVKVNGHLDLEKSFEGLVKKLNCYHETKAKDKYESFLQMLVEKYRDGRDIFLKYLLQDDKYKTLSDNVLKIIFFPLQRMQEEAIPASGEPLTYIQVERGIKPEPLFEE